MTKFSNNSFLSLVSYKNQNSIGRYVVTIIAVLFLAMGNVQAGNRYFSRVTGASNPTAGGSVIVNTTTTKSGTANTQVSGAVGSSANQNQTFYAWADPEPGYYWESWTGTKKNNSSNASITLVTSPQTATAQELTVKTAKSTSDYDYRSGNNGTGMFITYRDYAYDYTITANFAAIKVNSCDGHEDLSPTNPSTTYSGSATFTLNHTAATSDLNITLTPDASNHGTFTLGSPTIDGTTVTVNYTFKGNSTNYGGDDDNRNNSATLLVESKGDTGNGKSCTITANFPNAKITDGSATEIYTTYSPADDTQASVAGTAVFDVEYVDGTDNFDTPSITGANASFFTYNSMSYADGKLTVTYTYNGNKTAGDHTATLTLKVKDAIGGTDATYGSKAITIVAHNEQEALDDVRVTDANDEEKYQGDWATAIASYQGDGYTFTLLRNVAVTAAATFSKTITLDLNGKTLSGTVNNMLTINGTGKTLTIKDSKTGGKVTATIADNATRSVISLAKGKLILESGKIQMNATNTGSSVVARGVTMASGTTFDMNGGTIEAISAGLKPTAVYVVGTFNMTDGTLTTEAGTTTAYTLWINNGTANVTGGTITAHTIQTGSAAVYMDKATAVLNIQDATLHAIADATNLTKAGSANAYGVYNYTAGGTINVRQNAKIKGEANNSSYGQYGYGIVNRVANCKANILESTGVEIVGYSHYQYGIGISNAGTLDVIGGLIKGETDALHGADYAWGLSTSGTATIHGGEFKGISHKSEARGIYSLGATTIEDAILRASTTTSGAYGLLVGNNKTIATGVEIHANATTSIAYGVYLSSSLNSKTGAKSEPEAELNNLTVEATTGTKTASGVIVLTTRRLITSTASGYVPGDYVAKSNVTINGGTYTAIAGTTDAYGVYVYKPAYIADGSETAVASATINNATLVAKTTGANNNAYGIRTGGITTVNGCNITAIGGAGNGVTPAAGNVHGIIIDDQKTTVSNTIITSKGLTTAYGIYVNAIVFASSADANRWPTYGYTFHGEVEVNEGNQITAQTTGGDKSYGIYVQAKNANVASGVLAGDYAIAGTAVINGGKFNAIASGTTSYAAGVADPVLQGDATATPTLIINNGKFYGSAGTTPFADVSLAGEPGYFVLNGGYYVKDENLDKKLGEGMNKVAVKSGTPEYTEGYRWRITDNMTGEAVCKIVQNSTSYASLEEALQVVNATPNSTWTIIMIANYTLSKGDYVLPAKTTLLIPYLTSQTAAIGTGGKKLNPTKNVEPYEAPYPLYKLTFANGVNMTVQGTIEASAVTYMSNQNLTSRGTGIVSGAYGWLYLAEGSYIDLESTAKLIAWGYVTGKGEINAKSGSKVYEDFQIGDWRGGSAESEAVDNKNGLDSKSVFVITHYYYQNIECPITYRPGATAYGWGGTYMYRDGYTSFDSFDQAVPLITPVAMVGTSDAMFCMSAATSGDDTWVRKEYDPETDYVNWTMNSGASLGSIRIQMSLPLIGNMDVTSSDYVLPITSNFNIVANYGEISLTNHVCFIPGSKLTIKKEGILTIPTGQKAFFYDQDNWSSYGGYWFYPGYSPSWKVNPRVATIGDKTKVKMPDAEVLVEGTLNVQGAIYTTAGGANIHSTRENAGKVKFSAALPASTEAIAEWYGSSKPNLTLCQWTAFKKPTGGDESKVHFAGKALNPAWLKNEDGSYSKPTSANTGTGDTWTYMQSLTEDTYEWTLASEDGCFTTRKTGDTKTYVHPSDWVAVSGANANHAYPSEDGTRMFVNTEAASTSASCKWWDVNPTPEVIDAVTYYVANNENFDNFGTYYYWDNSVSYWKPKKVTVTWNDKDGNKITNGTFGDEYDFNTSPVFHGTNPTWANSATEKHDWIGWHDEDGNIYDKNATLPRATSNVIYTAYFNTTKYQYTITFKNNDNSDLWAGLVDAGTTGAELQALFETKYNEKTGNTVPQKAPTVDKVFTFTGWNTDLETVTAAATYTAQYSESPRKYHVTFYNYDAVSVLYEADVNYNTSPVYPDDAVRPFRANTSAYSYNWTGWQQGATHYGTTADLALVTGDVYYVATFSQTDLKYQVLFKRQDGSIIDAPFFSYEEKPSAFPANPTMASTVSKNYTFDHWDPAELVPVTEDGKVYTAYFSESPRQYTAHFVNYDGTSLGVDQTIDYNTAPTYTGVEPMKPNDSRNSFEFSGWAWPAGDGWEAGSVGLGETLPAIKGEITFTAQYTPTLLQFDVIYQREDGFVILRDKKKWGENSAFPTSGLDYEDETYTYTFDHWSPATVVTPVTANATYTAYYNQSIKTYSITAVGISPAGYGSVSPASLANIPIGSAVTVNDNKITVNGTTITATPAAATAQYTYTFDHWNNVPATVTGNVDNIEAVFTRTVNQYTVLWKSEDGTSTIETDDNQNYGAATAFNGTTPTKDATAQYTYTFDGWATEANGEKVYENGATPTVSGAATYYAHFAATLRKYTVSVAATPAGYGTVSAASVAEVPYGSTVTVNANQITVNGSTITATPAAATAQYTYSFSQWDNVPATVTGNVSIEAVFTRTVNQYTVLWKSEDGTSTIETDDNQNYGAATAFNGTTPTKDATAQYTYTFDGWATEANGEKVYENGATPTVSGAATYYAHFAQTTNAYTVTWKNADGTELEKDEDVSYGTTPEYNGETPTQTATATDVYTFAGWDSEIAAVTGNITYTATYTSVAPVASVTVSGETTYYATLQEAFDYASNKTTPTIDVLADIALAAKVTFTGAKETTITFDLNGHKVSGAVDQLLYIIGSKAFSFIIQDSSVGETGQLYTKFSSNKANKCCVYVYYGTVELHSGKIYMENTNTGANVTAYGVLVRSGANYKFNMKGGKIEVHSTKNAYGIYTQGTTTVTDGEISVSETKNGYAAAVHVPSGTTTISDNPTFTISGTKYVNGVRVGGLTPKLNSKKTAVTRYNGVANIEGGKFTVTASSNTAYGVYCYGSTYSLNYATNSTVPGNYACAGKANVSGGEFAVTSSGETAYGVYLQEPVTIQTALDADGNATYDAATTQPKANITGGKFNVSGASSVGAVNTAVANNDLVVEGGWFNINTNLDGYTAPTKACNFHVLPLTDEDPYMYEVAEAYTLTWNLDGGTVVTAGTQAPVDATGTLSGYVAAGATLTAPVVEKTGFTFNGWNTSGGTVAATMPAENTTYTATWVASIADRELDIVDWTSNSITINVTNLKAESGTNKNNWKICVNGTDYTRTSPECSTQSRTLTISVLSLKPNENLLIQLKNDAGVIESQHNYKIPQIYTENATLSGTNEESVVYVYGGKLAISGNTTLAALYVCPGAEVEVTGGTLTVGKLVLRTKPWATAAISGSVEATNIYYTRIAPDGSSEYPTGQYYQFGLPYSCAISEVRLSDGTTPAYTTTWTLKSYNEEKRATKGATGENWDVLEGTGTIAAGRGYEMFSSYKYYREYYFPVTPTDNTSVAVTRHGTDKNNSGWNIVCSPLMSIYQNESDPVTGLKVSWLLADGSYDQEWPEIIWPAKPFSYQASATGYLDFSSSEFNQTVSAPRRAAYKDNIQTEWLHLDVKNANGVGDHTSIFAHPDRFDATYETGIDVAKQSFTASRALIYSSHVYGEMAFAGLPDSLLEHGVALTVYSPINQELTISMRENNWLNRMAYVLLIDKETGAQVDLMNGNYTFEALEGTMRGRFFIQCVFNAEAPDISTGVNHLDTENDKAQKIMYNDKVYIIYQGRVYDMTGRQCELR